MINIVTHEPWVPNEVAVVGGGRWARVLASVLVHLNPAISHIHMISPRNSRGLDGWLSEARAKSRRFDCVHVWRDLASVLRQGELGAVVVANLPAQHATAAREALHSGCPVLVEKPMCSTRAEAEGLVAMAKERGLVLAVGHEFYYAAWPHRLREQLTADPAAAIDVQWHEQVGELRHGGRKDPDWSTNVASDLLVHVLTLLEVVVGRSTVSIEKVEVAHGCQDVLVRLGYGGVVVSARFVRALGPSHRRFRVVAKSGKTVEVDFHVAPATLRENGSVTSLPDGASTLAMQFHDFFRSVRGNGDAVVLAEHALDYIGATEQVARRVRDYAYDLLRSELGRSAASPPSAAATMALREHLVPSLFSEGLLDSPKDDDGFQQMAPPAFAVIHKMAAEPFTGMAELRDASGLDTDQFLRLCRALRDSAFVQDLIVNAGPARKYWQNTILPVARSGSLRAVVEREAQFPLRVGLYPGPSCMFTCTFCGRNYKASYEQATIPHGNDLLVSLLRDAPRHDPFRFYISGGLEPLTNPDIGNIVLYGSELGYNLSLYTNAMALTPKLLRRQPGLWRLHTLRISLYGVDEKTTFSVTRRRNAFAKVLKNTEDFLRERNRKRAATRIGFNFVILPGCSAQVLEVAELIARLNRRVGGRQVDFLTLREDYSVSDDQAIAAQERSRLVDHFARLQERIRQPDLDQLNIDYGYSLQALADGVLGRPLAMIDSAEIRDTGYPQVSVVVDLLGDVYAYREAGFIERPGADRYIIGRVSEARSMMDVVRDFVESGRKLDVRPGDVRFLDIFDHVVTALVNQAEQDAAHGLPFSAGPVAGRMFEVADAGRASRVLAHPTLETQR